VFDLERRGDRPFPVERAVILSLAAHLLLFLFFFSGPGRSASSADPRKGLLAAFVPPERDEVPIPVEFREAPGPQRENPKRSPLSDLERRAGGGDPQQKRSDTPFVPERPGVSGRESGARGQGRPAPVGPPRIAQASPDAAGKGGEGGEKRPEEPAPFFAPPRPDPGRGGAPLVGLDRAIREAARGAGGGDEGAGFPNPEGGFVDSGPLSFDTTWYDWGPYAAEMVRRIKLHWEIPSLARLGWKGKVTIRFFILADGRVDGARIVASSGVPPFDFAALQSILKSSPFRPLPTDLGSPREGVTVTFFYNIRPGREGAEEGTR
jgi:TonB family protein